MKKLRVLWFTNALLPEARKAAWGDATVTGPWMAVLLDELRKRTQIELAVVTAAVGCRDASFSEEGVQYQIIGMPRRLIAWTAQEVPFVKCRAAIEDFRPDIIHIHGTELGYGLISTGGCLSNPVVISIQGLVGAYRPHIFGSLSWAERIRATSPIELLRGTGLLHQYRKYGSHARREAAIIRANSFFLGRTLWDRAHVNALNPTAVYRHVGELMRPEFVVNRHRIGNCTRGTLFFTNWNGPMKGIEVAVQALEIVRRSHPFVRLKIAGASSASSAHGRLLMRRLRAANLMGSVDFLGFLSSKQLAQEMLNAHIFVSASHIENSPNSLAEAMLLGMPCIATFTGGVPSMMRDGVEGLLFPRGDAVTLAALIKTLIDDDVTAERFGCQARERALRDHDPETVVNQLVQSYREAMELSSDGRRI